DALGLADVLRLRLRELSEGCFGWVCRKLQQKTDPWQARLRMVKNAAYAWRQRVFFLSLLPHRGLRMFLSWAEAHLGKQPSGFRERFGPALAGLQFAASGAPAVVGYGASGPERFLGWTTGKHWLMV